MITYDPKSWVCVLLDFPRSPVFRTLAIDVLLAGAWGGLVAWIELDVVRVAIPLGPSFLSILGIILGVLLVFRTNTAYDRWREGRRLWGQLLNVSRALAHQLDAQLAPDAPQRRAYAAAMAAFPAALAAHLRRARASGAADGPHVPNQLTRALSRRVHADVATGALPREATVAPGAPEPSVLWGGYGCSGWMRMLRIVPRGGDVPCATWSDPSHPLRSGASVASPRGTGVRRAGRDRPEASAGGERVPSGGVTGRRGAFGARTAVSG